jgi:hypothetical protein
VQHNFEETYLISFVQSYLALTSAEASLLCEKLGRCEIYWQVTKGHAEQILFLKRASFLQSFKGPQSSRQHCFFYAVGDPIEHSIHETDAQVFRVGDPTSMSHCLQQIPQESNEL